MQREQEECWTECFREILNRPSPEEDADILEAADNLDIKTVDREKEEISKTIKSLKNGKAPGHDNLNAQLFKAGPELAATILQPPTGQSQSSSGYLRREHSLTATTGMALCCSLY